MRLELDNTATTRPLFLYGTLRAFPLLAYALTGDPAQEGHVFPLTEPTVTGFFRFLYHRNGILPSSPRTMFLGGWTPTSTTDT